MDVDTVWKNENFTPTQKYFVKPILGVIYSKMSYFHEIFAQISRE